jgi:hypothetical protein
MLTILTNGEEAYGRGLWSERRRYGHRGYDDETNSPGIDKYQKAPMTMLDFWSRSQSIAMLNMKVSMRCFDLNERGFLDWRGDFTLFAGFVFNFSKIFCDCALVALMVIGELITQYQK